MEWKSTDTDLPKKDDNCIVALRADGGKEWVYGWWLGYHVIDNYRNEHDQACRVKWWMKIEKPE